MQPHEYAYTATPEDMKEFLKFTEQFNLKRAADLNPLKSHSLTITFLTILGLVSLGYHWYLNPEAINWPLTVAIGAFVFAAGGFVWQMQQRAETYFDYIANEEGFMLGEHSISINDEGITEKARFSTISIPWQSVYDLYDEPEYLFIYIGNMLMFTIPKRAFPNREEYESVYQQMCEQMAR